MRSCRVINEEPAAAPRSPCSSHRGQCLGGTSPGSSCSRAGPPRSVHAQNPVFFDIVKEVACCLKAALAGLQRRSVFWDGCTGQAHVVSTSVPSELPLLVMPRLGFQQLLFSRCTSFNWSGCQLLGSLRPHSLTG